MRWRRCPMRHATDPRQSKLAHRSLRSQSLPSGASWTVMLKARVRLDATNPNPVTYIARCDRKSQPNRSRAPPMTEPLWTPEKTRAAQTTLGAFSVWMASRADKPFAEYDELHRCSTHSPAEFWSALCDFAGVLGDKGANPEASTSIATWPSWRAKRAWPA